jgi:hypothetical protein
MAASKASRVVAVATFQAGTKDGPALVHAGDVVPARSAIVTGRESLFVALENYHRTEGTPPAPQV